MLALAALAGCVPDKGPPRSVAQGPGYVVRPGDTLSGIAQRYGVMLSTLARANRIPPPYLIRVGQRLAVPAPERRVANQSYSRPVVQPLPAPSPVPTRAVTTPPSRTGAPRLVWPADGPVVESFGSGADPRGIAIATHAGAAVRSAASGTVLFAGPEPQKYGLLVIVDHGNGWVTAYANLARVVVTQGEAVRANARLGFAGERPLHFELRRDNAPADPLPQLPPRF